MFFFLIFLVHKICGYVHKKCTNNIASLHFSLQDALDLDVMSVDLEDLFINQKQNVILAWVFGSYL